MKILTLVCNAVLVAFTLFVVATDGPPTEAAYGVFPLVRVVVPLLTILTLMRSRAGTASVTRARRLTAGGNIAVLALASWALIDQYPHPNEPGFVPYVVLLLATPILSAATLLRRPHGVLPA